MNWRRGFGRLWLLVTLVWVAVTFMITRPDLDRLAPWHAPIVLRDGETTRELPRDIPASDLRGLLIALDQQSRKDDDAFCSGPGAKIVPRSNIDQKIEILSQGAEGKLGLQPQAQSSDQLPDGWWRCMQRADTVEEYAAKRTSELLMDDGRVRNFLLVGTIPPAFLFAAGLAIGWVVRGFLRAA